MRLMMYSAETLFSVEHQEIQAEGIKGCNKYTRHYRKIGKTRTGQMRVFDGLDNAVLGIEAREEWGTDQCQRTNQEGNPGVGHVFAQTAHVADVLIMVHTDNHTTCGKEQQRLEERVRHQVEDTHRVGRYTQRHEHVTELRQSGVGNHSFYIILNDAEKTHEQRVNRTNDHDERQGSVRQLEQGGHPRNHENTGGNHCRRMDQGRDRGRAFHRIRQPDM